MKRKPENNIREYHEIIRSFYDNYWKCYIAKNKHDEKSFLKLFCEPRKTFLSFNGKINLDDGVKVNYAKFGSALEKIPGLEDKEE